MSDGDRLRSKLDRLSAPEERAGLFDRLGAGGDAARIAFCEFIDEIVLAREVTFASSAMGDLVAQVSNRRLLRITQLPEGLAADPGVSEALRPGDADQIMQVAGAVAAFLDGSGPLEVREEPLPARLPAEMLGRSAAALAAALGVSLYSGAPVGGGAETVAAGSLDHLALAIRHRSADGGIASTSGQADLFRSERSAVETPLSEVFRGVLKGPAIAAVFARSGNSTALLVSDTDGTTTEAVIAADRIAEALALHGVEDAAAR